MLGQKNITHVYVGKNTALATGARSAMTAGQLGIFVNGSTTASASALSTGNRFKVVLKDNNGNFIESPLLDVDQLTRKVATDYAAPTEKKVYIGYNGSTGSVGVANSTVYLMHMNMQDSTSTWGEHPYFKMIAAYQSSASATQTEIVDALILNAVKNFEREVALGVDYVKVGRINSAAVTATNDFTGDTTIVQGSDVISIAESGNNNDAAVYGAGAVDLAVGDYVRIGSVGGGTALTSQVYKVTALGGAKTSAITATLDRVVLEASGTYAAATHDIEVIPAASVSNWGLSFEGKPLAFEAGLKEYRKVDFTIQLGSDFPTTLVTVSTSGTKGDGTYQEVAENEWDLKGNRGETYRVASYPVTINLNATVGATYDTINVDFTNSNSIAIDKNVLSFGSLLIYVANDTAGTSGSTAYTNLKTVFGL